MNTGIRQWFPGRVAFVSLFCCSAAFAADRVDSSTLIGKVLLGYQGWSPPNQIPRNRGEFLWRQAYNAKTAGAKALKIAMFDEVNEGTAVFKVASNRRDAPDQGFWLTLDADGADLPSDWYLRLAGEITRMFHGDIPASAQMPLNLAGNGKVSTTH